MLTTTKENSKEPHYRLFEEHSIEDIAERTGYSFVHLAHIKVGNRKLSTVFKRFAATAYGQTEDELFEKLEVGEDATNN